MHLKTTAMLLILCHFSHATLDIFNSESHSPSPSMRQKKKLLVKKSVRGQRLRSLSANRVEYSKNLAPTEPSNSGWKPIIPKTDRNGHFINDADNGGHYDGVRSTTGYFDQSKNSPLGGHQHVVVIDNESPTQRGAVNGNGDNYALLHYYIPFDQVKGGKPIEEPLSSDTTQKPLSLNDIMQAAVQPVAIFRPKPTRVPHSKPTKQPHYHSTPKPIIPVLVLNENEHKNKETTEDPSYAGKYEYEYFVRDSHHGTNFGHKEYRDGKETRGDYEVVLPDNRVQHVKYWSDASGYHADVSYHPLPKHQQFK